MAQGQGMAKKFSKRSRIVILPVSINAFSSTYQAKSEKKKKKSMYVYFTII